VYIATRISDTHQHDMVLLLLLPLYRTTCITCHLQLRTGGFCSRTFFRRPFVKQFALCYQTVVCPVLSVTLVYCGQMVGWINVPLGMEVGLALAILCYMGTQLPSPERAQQHPQFSAHPVVVKQLDGSRCHLVRR